MITTTARPGPEQGSKMGVDFTIVTPSFNQARFLRATLDSVAAQTVDNYEHLLFDPGSKDGSQAIISAYTAEAPDRRRHVFGQDTSQTNAINLGFAEARGEYVCWLNSDDAYTDAGVLAAVKERFESDPTIDIVYGLGDFIDPSGAKIRSAYINRNPDELRSAFLTSIGILQPSLFMRRRAFSACGPLFEGMNYSFDYEYWVRALFAGMKFSFLPRNLSRAIIHNDAKTMSNRGISLEECAQVCRTYYGFVSKEWVDRLESFRASGSDGIVQASESSVAPEVYVRDWVDLSSAASWLHLPSAALSRSAILSNSPLGASRKIVTGFDQHYFSQGLTLISSLGRHGFLGSVVVYDLGLTTEQLATLRAIDGVIVTRLPADLCPGDWYLEPKNYVYKNLIAHHVAQGSSEGALVLWVDAGVAFQHSPDELFESVEEYGAIFVDHDDRPSWPFYNATFTTDASLIGMAATVGEAAAPHICSCLFGFRNDAGWRALFEESYVLSCNPAVSLGEKHPEIKTQSASDIIQSREKILSRSTATIDGHLITEVRNIFGYSGHRQDQSIFSILANRHSAKILSASKACRATNISSAKSKLNHTSGSVDDTIPFSKKIESDYEGAISIHHRGTFQNFDFLNFAGRVSGDACAIIGNGPSLKNFDLRRIGKMASIGMNAAYRHWERIGWYPSYYSCLDLVVGESHKDAILDMVMNRHELGINLFVLRSNLVEWLRERSDDPAIINFDTLRGGSEVLSSDPITTGSHSAAFSAMLGYKRIYLLGIDCNYVEKVDGAVSVNGNILEISEQLDNPNYFFSDYQRAGDRFNIPNPNPGLHLRSWQKIAPLVEERGGKIFNTNTSSAVDIFESISTADFIESECHGLEPGLARDARAGVDETGVVAHMLAGRKGRQFVMLDVGAHFGTSAQYFDRLGWTIHCFEPDPKNRAKLTERFSGNDRVVIDPRAVSDTPATGVSFFTSEESTGISGLHSFRDTHAVTGLVDVTTLSEVVDSRGISHVDFLKIDVEGFDLSVLKGMPWDRLKPDVIEAEFEDAKTLRLGHNYKDICEYLVARGYTVYLSEWHPIIRYGISHDWRRVFQYPAPLASEDAWGNLLAFREDPGLEAVRSGFDACIKFRAPPPNDHAKVHPTAPASTTPRTSSPLEAFRGRHTGERCFIMGNGPSLNQMDLAKLAGETVFACNGVDLLFDRIAWRPTYYVSVDSRVLPDRAHEVKAMLAAYPDTTAFFPEVLRLHDGSGQSINTREMLMSPANAVFFNEVANDPSGGVGGMFSLDASERVIMPFTVTVTMLQLAAWMGFSEIYLIGCDTAYSIPESVVQNGEKDSAGTGLLLTSTQDDDPNHFDPRYFGKGRKWHNPQVASMVMHYGFAKQALDAAGIKTFNATVGGELNVFPRVSFDTLFAGPKPSSPKAGALERQRPNRDLASDLSARLFIAAGPDARPHIDNDVPVMLLSGALSYDRAEHAAYLVAVDPEDAARLLALSKAVARPALRRAIVDHDILQSLPSSERLLDLRIASPFLGVLADGRSSAIATALAWASVLGFSDLTVSGLDARDRSGPGSQSRATLDAIVDRLEGQGVVIRFDE